MTVETQQRLPEGCEAKIEFYLASVSADLEIVVGLGGLTALPSFEVHEQAALNLIKSLSAAVAADLGALATDWRFMSRAEVADYKRRRSGDRHEDDGED